MDQKTFDQYTAIYIKSAGNRKTEHMRIRHGSWRLVMELRKQLKSGTIQVVEAKFASTNSRGWNGKAAPDFLEESTYEDCVSFQVNFKENTIKVLFYNGDMMHGQPQELRCWWILKVDLFDYEGVHILLQRIIDDMILDLREKELKAIEQKARQRILDKLISQI